MPHPLIIQLNNHPSTYELTKADWLELQDALTAQPNEADDLIKAYAAQSGLGIDLIKKSLINADANALDELQAQHQANTHKINQFQQHSYFKKLDLKPLAVSRSEWLSLIEKFEQQKRQVLNSTFFLITLSMIRKTSYYKITALLSREQPSRDAKAQVPAVPMTPPQRKRYAADNGVNPLVAHTLLSPLNTKLQATGVRVVPLHPATPEKGELQTVRTPGHTKYRALCTVNSHTLFKPLTPVGQQPRTGRVDLSQANRENIAQAVPNLNWKRPSTVTFIANLDILTERSNQSRRSNQTQLTRESASNVFRAHGIQIESQDTRHYHWAHLIAYFLGGDQDTVNLVPSTAAANYNTLEAIELFIKDKLISKKTAEIKISVEPKFSGDELIPELLIYKLSWKEAAQDYTETFYINPQSYQRITQSMHKSIAVLRDEPPNTTPGM